MEKSLSSSIKPTTDLLSVLDFRARALRSIRDFFYTHGYREVDTPLLCEALIPESVIQAFVTTRYDITGKAARRFLIPSPELWMKRLLAAGSGSIFQITKCFRNHEPPTKLHSPEFTMLEWYAVGKDYRDNMELQERLVAQLRRRLKIPRKIRFGDQTILLRRPYRRLTMREAFGETVGIDLQSCRDFGSLVEAAARCGIGAGADDNWESLFHKLFLQEVEPLLPMDRPLFLTDYPAPIETLARLKQEGPWVERWELYIGGVEIANCYTEERDPDLIRSFFQREDAVKKSLHHEHQTDWDLAGIVPLLPECSGNALGVDRLLMVLLGRKNLKDVSAFLVD